MLDHYQVVSDWGALDQFCEHVLTPESDYYVQVMARSKYVAPQRITGDMKILRKFVTSPDYLGDRLWQSEAPLNAYNADGVPIPDQALCAYITVTPRDVAKAARTMLTLLAEKIALNRPLDNLINNTYTEVHRARGYARFVTFDFDLHDRVPFQEVQDHVKKTVKDVVNPDALYVIYTRGGYHLLVEIDKVDTKFRKSFYKQLAEKPDFDKVPDMSPIPGTFQGGHPVAMYKVSDNLSLIGKF